MTFDYLNEDRIISRLRDVDKSGQRFLIGFYPCSFNCHECLLFMLIYGDIFGAIMRSTQSSSDACSQ